MEERGRERRGEEEKGSREVAGEKKQYRREEFDKREDKKEKSEGIQFGKGEVGGGGGMVVGCNCKGWGKSFSYDCKTGKRSEIDHPFTYPFILLYL